jgi:CarD family transcriptional regulator
LLGDGKIDSQQNWKGRFKDNSDRMRTGSLYDVVEVLKSLTFLAKSKTLSFREKRMLDRARFLVVSEIAEVTREALPNIEEKVDLALESSIATKGRVGVKTTAVAVTPVQAVASAKPPAAPARPQAIAKAAKGGTAVATKRVIPRMPQA